MKKLTLLLFFCAGLVAAFAQEEQSTKSMSRKERKAAKRERINQLIRQEEEGEMVFNKHNVWGFKLNTDGWGASYEKGKFKTNKKTILYQIEFNEKKHPKEKKISQYDNFGFRNIVFGKTNNFYQFKLGMAVQNRIGGKANKNGVAVSRILGGGFSLGLEKPYYVDVDVNGQEERKTFPEIIEKGYGIYGASGFFVGWSDVKLNPGVHAKAAMRFDYGRFNEMVTAIETGLMAEFYASKVSQMAYIEEKQFFFNAYVSFIIGRRK